MNKIKKNELFLLEEIIKKNFAVKYKNSFLGILWSVVQPLLMMILITIIFSAIFTRSIENFPVYFLSGKCIYDFFHASTHLTMISIKGNKNILKRTAAPKHIFVLGGVASEFLNFIISLIILIFVMIVTHAQFHFLTMPLSILPIISLLLMLTGIGLILSIMCVYFTDIQHLWTVLTLMIMYASALFYPMDIIPEPFYDFMVLNPLYWVINQFREFFLWGMIPEPINMLNLFLLSSIILVIGLIVFKKYEKRVTMKF